LTIGIQRVIAAKTTKLVNRTVSRLFTILGILVLPGCGTVCNLADGVRHPDQAPRTYGGVARNLEWISEGQIVENPYPESWDEAVENFYGIAYWTIIDPPLSFVGDTLTLPLTWYLQDRRERSRCLPKVRTTDRTAGVNLD
jgi:uncharacterized protein YceK